jgi:hypothetical protein
MCVRLDLTSKLPFQLLFQVTSEPYRPSTTVLSNANDLQDQRRFNCYALREQLAVDHTDSQVYVMTFQ